MAQSSSPQEATHLPADNVPAAEDDEALRKRLLSRIAVAGVVILGLLGGLAVFDSLNKPHAPSMPKMAAVPAESAVKEEAEKSSEAKPVEESKPEAAKEEEAKTVVAEPERTETPLAPMPADRPLKAAKPVTPQATARQAAVKPAPPVAAPARPETTHEIARAIPEKTAPAHAPASRPLTQAAESARRFLVQVGVFSNHANAEELAMKLQQAGIPAQIESRVQVGPFASRAEADLARAKLKSLGIDDGMLVRR